MWSVANGQMEKDFLPFHPVTVTQCVTNTFPLGQQPSQIL